MNIIRDKISIDELKKMSEKMFGDIVKAVDADLHADFYRKKKDQNKKTCGA